MVLVSGCATVRVCVGHVEIRLVIKFYGYVLRVGQQRELARMNEYRTTLMLVFREF
jgi:hypothetical protein